jgi:predicted secreted protein
MKKRVVLFTIVASILVNGFFLGITSFAHEDDVPTIYSISNK